MNQPVFAEAILRFTENGKKISRKKIDLMLKKPACKIAIFMKFKYELYSDEELSSGYFETFYFSNL